jgi:hypothetical protein
MEDDTNNNGKTLGESYSRKGSGQSTTSTVGTISAVGLEMDEEEEEEGEWVEKKKGATSPPRSLVGGSAVKTVRICVYYLVYLYFGCVRVCGVHNFSLVEILLPEILVIIPMYNILC